MVVLSRSLLIDTRTISRPCGANLKASDLPILEPDPATRAQVLSYILFRLGMGQNAMYSYRVTMYSMIHRIVGVDNMLMQCNRCGVE